MHLLYSLRLAFCWTSWVYMQLAFIPALYAVKILWIVCLNGIKQCIHGDVILGWVYQDNDVIVQLS